MKRNYWPLFFIGIFSFVFGMIVWTIYSAIEVPVNEDETFLKSYHELDKDYNDVVISNKKFLQKYNFKVVINEKTFPLEIGDMFLSQRAIEEKSNHKNLLKSGQNTISIDLTKSDSKEIIEDLNINFRVSRPTNHNSTMDFTSKDFTFKDGKYVLDLKLPLKGNWNITATFKTNNDIGYFYIKSNAI